MLYPHYKIKVLQTLFALLCIYAFLISACSAGRRERQITTDLDTYEGLSDALEQHGDILVYDVRSSAEFATGSIPGAFNIPHNRIAEELPEEYINRTIVIYCLSGARSSIAYKLLASKGFNHVFDFGSIRKWQGSLEYPDKSKYRNREYQ